MEKARSRTEVVYGEITLTAPPLIFWYAALKGWRHESTALLSTAQLEQLDDLKPMAAYQLNNDIFANVGLYGAAVCRLLSSPTAAAHVNGNSRHMSEWYARAAGDPAVPTIYTCHSSSAELFVAIYNVASAAMQKAAILEHKLKTDSNVLTIAVKLMGSAREILASLKDLTHIISTSSHLSPSNPPPAAMKLAEHGVLETLYLLASVQYLELQLIGYKRTQMTPEAIALGIAIVDAYNVLYERVVDEDEFLCSSPGYLRRLIAIKRHFYRLITTIEYIDYRPDVPSLPSLLFTAAKAAKETLKSLDKNKALVAGIGKVIGTEVEMAQLHYWLLDTKTHQGGNDYWEAIVSVMSGHMPLDMSTPSRDLAQLASSVVNVYAFRLFILKSINDDPQEAEQRADELRTAWTSRLEELTVPLAPVPLAKGPPPTPPQFAQYTQLYTRCRRLAILLKSLSSMSDEKDRLKSSGPENSLPGWVLLLERLMSLLYSQCLDYTMLISHIFFDNSKITGPEQCAVDLRTLTTLAHTTLRNEAATPLSTLNTQEILAHALNDRDVLDARIQQVEQVEQKLRDEISALGALIVQFESPPSLI